MNAIVQPGDDGGARARSHQHADTEAVITLVSRDRGARDIPPFEMYVFEDGCFRGEFGYCLDDVVHGAVASHVVHRLLLDAESLGVPRFSEVYELQHDPSPDLDMEFRLDGARKHIRYSPVSGDFFAEQALERGEAFARELFTVHLIGARVIDLVCSRR